MPVRDRAQLGLDARGQLRLHLRDAFANLLAREVDVGAVFEDDRHLRRAHSAKAIACSQLRHTGERRFEREGNALLGFERRVTSRLGVDLYLNVGDVGRRVDRQLLCSSTRRAPRCRV